MFQFQLPLFPSCEQMVKVVVDPQLFRMEAYIAP